MIFYVSSGTLNPARQFSSSLPPSLFLPLSSFVIYGSHTGISKPERRNHTEIVDTEVDKKKKKKKKKKKRRRRRKKKSAMA